jgi:S-adenosylmethionine/arginine decarboxylase-like enzyme
MKIDYVNGQRVTPLPHELSPLDAAIERYAEQAREYYKNEKSLDKSLTRQQRDEKLKTALHHLELERMRTEAIIEVQTQLAEYQAFGRESRGASGRALLSAEAHHPTKILAKYMRASGKPMPSSKHTPHHIVLGKGKTNAAGLARLHIHRYGIRINDPDNAAWLVKDKKDVPHWSMPNAKSHLTIHTHNYETWVLQSIRVGRSEAALRQKLNLLGKMLQHGDQPKHVTLPPDENWSGQ